MQTHGTERMLFGACADGYHQGCRAYYLTVGAVTGTVMMICSCACHQQRTAAPAAREASRDDE